MEAKHTPGPHKVFGERITITGFGIYAVGVGFIGVANDFKGPNPRNPGEGKANARLIAAAPDLLAALEEAEFALRGAAEQYASDKGQRSTVLDGRLEIVRQAISEAKGGE